MAKQKARLPRGRAGARASTREVAERGLRPDGEVRRATASTSRHSAAYGLLTVPDRVPEGALPGRVLRRPAHLRQGQDRQGGQSSPRRAPGASRCCRPTSTSRTPSSPWCRSAETEARNGTAIGNDGEARQGRPPRGQGHPLRAGGGQGRGRGRGRGRSERRATAGGPFLSMIDFCNRVDGRKVNRKVLEALVKSGAFDGIARPATASAARAMFAAIARRARRRPPRPARARERPDLAAGAVRAAASADRSAPAAASTTSTPTSRSGPPRRSWPSRRRASASTSAATRSTASPASCAGSPTPTPQLRRARARAPR